MILLIRLNIELISSKSKIYENINNNLIESDECKNDTAATVSSVELLDSSDMIPFDDYNEKLLTTVINNDCFLNNNDNNNIFNEVKQIYLNEQKLIVDGNFEQLNSDMSVVQHLEIHVSKFSLY